mgnify:FL=1
MLYVLILLIINALLTAFMYFLTEIPIVTIIYIVFLFVYEGLIYFAYRVVNDNCDEKSMWIKKCEPKWFEVKNEVIYDPIDTNINDIYNLKLYANYYHRKRNGKLIQKHINLYNESKNTLDFSEKYSEPHKITYVCSNTKLAVKPNFWTTLPHLYFKYRGTKVGSYVNFSDEYINIVLPMEYRKNIYKTERN